VPSAVSSSLVSIWTVSPKTIPLETVTRPVTRGSLVTRSVPDSPVSHTKCRLLTVGPRSSSSV